MVVPDDGIEAVQTAPTTEYHKGACTEENPQKQDLQASIVDRNERDWRAQLGEMVVATQLTVDSNLTLVRVGCLLVMAGSAYAAIRFSGMLSRFGTAESIPASYFRQRKTLRVRMVRQSTEDPSILYVYHTPFWRRVLLQDTLPPITRPDRPEPLIAVRAFGIQVDESASGWIYANLASSNRYMTLTLLRRMSNAGEDQSTLASCTIALRRFPFAKDLAHELVSRGLADCLPEDLEQYAEDGFVWRDFATWITPVIIRDGRDLTVDAPSDRNADIQPLLKRLKQLEAAQKHAQTMQYGIWTEWRDERLSGRVLSAGRRATSRGLQKLLSRVTASNE